MSSLPTLLISEEKEKEDYDTSLIKYFMTLKSIKFEGNVTFTLPSQVNVSKTSINISNKKTQDEKNDEPASPPPSPILFKSRSTTGDGFFDCQVIPDDQELSQTKCCCIS